MVNGAKETKREVTAGGKESLVSGMLSVCLEAAASPSSDTRAHS